MIKIASLIPYKILPAINGGEKAVFFFQKHVAAYAQLTSFTVTENKDGSTGIDFKPILGSTRQKLRYVNPLLYFTIKKICRQQNIKHVIIEHPYYAWLGYALQKWAGIKWIIRSHNIEAARFKSMDKWWWKMMHWYEKLAHCHADLSFFITEEDLQYAVGKYSVDIGKCAVATYGVETSAAPSYEEKEHCKETVCNELGIAIATKLILFNGTLDYKPNRDGLDRILKEINPVLQTSSPGSYKIIICGLRLPQEYDELKSYQDQHIIYKGFIKDIGLYFKAADVFINPITDGGGIKTKLVEALAANTPAVSFKTGAYGVPLSVTGDHLSIVENGDSKTFAEAIIEKLWAEKKMIPAAFYEHFSWNAIAQKAVKLIEDI